MTPKLYYSDITGQISHERVDPSQYLYHHDSVVKELVEAGNQALEYLGHVRGWSSHGPATINTSDLYDKLDAALSAVEGL